MNIIKATYKKNISAISTYQKYPYLPARSFEHIFVLHCCQLRQNEVK